MTYNHRGATVARSINVPVDGDAPVPTFPITIPTYGVIRNVGEWEAFLAHYVAVRSGLKATLKAYNQLTKIVDLLQK